LRDPFRPLDAAAETSGQSQEGKAGVADRRHVRTPVQPRILAAAVRRDQRRTAAHVLAVI
jgi:hypothetical protein